MNSNTKIFTQNDKFLMLAFDHRGSFAKMINPYSKELAIETKRKIIQAVYDQMSGSLIDLDYGFPAYIDLLKNTKNNPKPFLLPIENSGYIGEAKERITELGYTAKQLKEYGAAGIKILVYFNKDKQTALKQIETTKNALEDAKKENLPFFLEIVNYDNENNPNRVVDSLRAFIENGIYPDVYKLEYPGSFENAKEVTNLLRSKNIPWIQLTRGTSFDEFAKQLEISVSAGCVGFLAGRSLWQEGPKLTKQEDLDNFYNTVLPSRFRIISNIVLN